MSGELNKPYNPSMAELGKFIEVTSPSVSSFGHYAILTVNAGSLPVSAGGQPQDNYTVTVASSAFGADGIFTYNANVKEVDIQNYTGGRIYYLPQVDTITNVKNNGIIIENTGYFSVKRQLTGFSVASLSAGEVKIMIYT